MGAHSKTSPAGALTKIERHFGAQKEHILAVAIDADPRGSERWDEVLTASQLKPGDGDQRAARSAELGVKRGALPGELRLALHVLALKCEAMLKSVTLKWPELLQHSNPLSARVNILKARFERVVDEEGHSYDLKIRPGAHSGAGLGLIFANARRSAALDPWSHLKWRGCLTLVCSHCGAPQREARNFTCAYCEKNIFGRRRHKS